MRLLAYASPTSDNDSRFLELKMNYDALFGFSQQPAAAVNPMGLPVNAGGQFGLTSYLPQSAEAAQTAWAMPTSQNFGAFASGYQNPNAQGGGGLGNWFKDANNLNAAFSGISALTSAYLGFQQLRNAKDSLRFQKEAFNTNMNNSIKSYNTSLEDRIRGRTSDYEGKESDVQSYLDRNRLSRSG